MLPYNEYEQKLLDLMRRQSLTVTMGALQNQRLVLGGVRGSGGGGGGPIQPFIGKLTQSRVTYDTDEFATVTTSSGELASLVDNLNHIRAGVVIRPVYAPINYTVPSGLSSTLIDHLQGIDIAIPSGGGGTGSGVAGAWPAPEKLMIGTTEYSTLSAAISAASSGDLIKVGEGQFACENLTLPSGIDLLGTGVQITNLVSSSSTNALNLAGSNNIKDLSVSVAISSSSNLKAVNIAGVGVLAYRVKTYAYNGGTGDGYGWYIDPASANAQLFWCQGYGGSVDGLGYGLYCDQSVVLTQFGRYDGTHYSMYSNGATSAPLIHWPVLKDIGVTEPLAWSGGAAPVGWYIEDTSSIICSASDGIIKMEELTSAPLPPTGYWEAYFKSGGLYVKDDTGTETGPLGTGGGSGGWPFNTKTVDATDADADYSSLNSGITAESSGTWFSIGRGQFAVSQQAKTDMVFVGEGWGHPADLNDYIGYWDDTTYTYGLKCNSGNQLLRLFIYSTSGSRTPRAVELAGGSTIHGCYLWANATGSDDSYALYVNSGTNHLIGSYLKGTSSGGNGGGIYVASGATLYISGMPIVDADAGWEVLGTGNVYGSVQMTDGRILTFNGAANTAYRAAGWDTHTHVTKTISGGAITCSLGTWFHIGTQGGASQDDLDTISLGYATAGTVIFVQAATGGQVVTLKHNTGNIFVPWGQDINLQDDDTIVMLICEYTGTYRWTVISVGNPSEWPGPNMVMIGTTRYTSISTACAAATSGDLIKIGPGTFTASAVDVPSGVDMVGSGRDITVISTSANVECLNFQGNNVVQNLTIQNTYSVASDINAIRMEGANCTFRNVKFYISNASGGGQAILTTSNNMLLEDCIGLGTGYAAGSYICVYNYGGSEHIIRGGSFEGDDADIDSGTGSGVFYLEGPRFVNNLVSTVTMGGTYTGWHFDNNYAWTGRGVDVYPQTSTQGLNSRVERLFGDDVPAHNYHLTFRDFATNDFTNHIAGFEDSQGTPYSFGGSPGGFSVTVPANTRALSSVQPHMLTLHNQSGTGVYMEWTSSTGKNDILVIGAPAALWTTTDYNLCEIRMWGVQSPGSSDNYWAMRLNWMGSTYPQYPLRIGLWYGTGVTYAWNDGTLISPQAPYYADNAVARLQATVTTGPSCFLTPYGAEGTVGIGISTTVASWPTSVKTARIRLDNVYTYYHIDTFKAL